MTPNSAIKRAMRLIGAVAIGETPSAAEMADSLEALNAMLKSWSAQRLIIHYTTWGNFSLVAGTASYTIGSGSTWNATRPTRILGGFVRDSNGIDHDVRIIGEDYYRRLSLKSNSARPDKLWYNPAGYAIGTCYVYPTPAAVETIHLFNLVPLTTFTSLTTLIELPGEYEEPLAYNLAVRLAPEFERSVPPAVAALAVQGLDTLKTLNAANQVEEIFAEPAVAQGQGRYDINQG